jgi:hypothetical protein
MIWGQSLGQQAPRIPLFRGLGEGPMEPRRAWTRQAWLLQARRALAFQREWLDMMRERIELVDQSLAAEIEEEAEREQPRRRSRQGPRPGVATPPSRPGAPSERGTARERRRAALEAVFAELQEDEFLQDGMPRVENVNTRLSARGEEAGATRREIDEAFERWQKRQESE